jgi:hypothetical protein
MFSMPTRPNNSARYIVAGILLLVSLWGCGRRTTDNVSDYLAWANDPDNGLVRTKSVNGLEITVRYLSPEYRAYLELRGRRRHGGESVDSLIRSYERSVAFLMTISAHGGDVMMRDVASYSDYAERMATMNFDMTSFLALVADGATYRPVLATLEDGISPTRTIIVVFADEEGADRLTTAESLDFVFSDTIFETGIDHFSFVRRDIDDRLRLRF